MGSSRKSHPGVAATEKQDWFVQLIRSGVSNSEACRIVGINRRTGTRWRLGRTILNTAGDPVHYPPVPINTSERVRHPRYLSVSERELIADLLRDGATMRQIASELGRSPSTISRELRRNRDDVGRYRPHAAEQFAADRMRSRRRLRRLRVVLELGSFVQGLLDKRWSPEQVAHELSVRFAGRPEMQLCTESIYQVIYDPRVPVGRPARRRRRRRRRRVQGLERRGRLTSMKMISDRPVEAQDRSQGGNWEGDSLMGAGNCSAIGTLVERRSRFLILLHLPPGRPGAQVMADAVAAALLELPPELRQTLTWDQGKELAGHRQISERTGTAVYFCEPHSPWQRPSNENMNGLLRDYFPKGTDLGVVTAQQLADVAAEVNARPRKTLGWARPVDLFTCPSAVATA